MTEPTSENPMQELRLRMLKSNAADLGFDLARVPDQVFGLLMDWPVGEQTVTVVALQDGNASLYSTSTFGVIGGFAHEKVQIAAKHLVNQSRRFLDLSRPTEQLELPASNITRFYLLTGEGPKTIDVRSDEVISESNKLNELFSSAQNLITELRLVVEAGSESEAKAPKREWVGEPGYLNCLLTLMSEGILSDVLIEKEQAVPDLLTLSEGNSSSHAWIAAQEFDFPRLSAKRVIDSLVKGLNIKGMPFSTRTGSLPTIHARNDGKNIARIFDVIVQPFGKNAKISMAPDSDPRLVELQRQADKK